MTAYVIWVIGIFFTAGLTLKEEIPGMMKLFEVLIFWPYILGVYLRGVLEDLRQTEDP